MRSDQSNTQNGSEQKKANSDSTQTSMSKKTESNNSGIRRQILSIRLVSRFGDKLIHVIYIRPGRTKILVPSHEIVQVASFIKDTLGFDHAESVSGTDYPK